MDCMLRRKGLLCTRDSFEKGFSSTIGIAQCKDPPGHVEMFSGQQLTYLASFVRDRDASSTKLQFV